MQGFPLEGYEPLPPNSPEDIYREEVENRSDAGSVATPLLENPESALVTVEDSIPHTIPVSEAPLEPLLVRLDSFGNIIEEEVQRLPLRPYTETQMEDTQHDYDEYITPVQSAGMVNPQQTPVRSIWRTPSGRDLYEHFNFSRPPLDPHDPLASVVAEAGPSSQTIDHPIEQVVNPAATSTQIQLNVGVVTPNHAQGTSTITPTTTPFHTTTPYVPQNPVGTPLHQRMQTLSIHTQSTAGQIPTGGKPSSSGPVPPGGQPPLHIPVGGQPPFIGQTTVVTQPMAGGKPPFVRNPSQPWGVPQGGTFNQPYQGGKSYHNPQGGVPNPVPSRLYFGQPYPGVPNPTWGPQGQQTYPPQGSNVYPPQGQNVYPPQGKTIYPPQPNQPTYTPQNQPGFPPLMNVPQQQSNPAYTGQQQPYMGGPTGYNYPPQPVYGPTGVPMPHQYHPQVNRQLPFLATLDLPDLSRLTNDPILHFPFWPVIPAKLPSDIPKFDGKPGEDPNNHVMTFHLWCSSNSLMDDSIHLHLFQRTLTGSAAKWYIELQRGTFQDFNSLAMDFLTHFQLPIHYETGTELLTSLHQTNSVHISDHIHEWRRRRRLIKATIPDQLLAEWFTKSLLPPISRDVAMGGVVTEEEAIARAQYLDLVYSQSGTLYELIPNAPRTSTDPSKPSSMTHADGVIGTVKTQSSSQSTRNG
jgi:hypothetical protein